MKPIVTKTALVYMIPATILAALCQFLLWLFPAKIVSKPLGDSQRILFVVNHNLWAVDMPMLFAAIYITTGIWPRGLQIASVRVPKLIYLVFQIPLFSHFLAYVLGAFEGSRDLCDEAMRRELPLLVFPGGSKEVWRPLGYEKYSLQWGNRSGFARMAIQHGYTIVPVASVGVDDMFKILFHLPSTLLLSLFGDKREGASVPVIFPVSYQTQYFSIGEPILTKGLDLTDENIQSIRDQSFNAIQNDIYKLKKEQETDPARYVIQHRIACITRWITPKSKQD